MSNKKFYRAFEDKHRGSRELIKERVSVYLPFVLPLKAFYSDVTALDIGCGRGEWLELLHKHDITAQGIDLDKSMLKACHSLGLDAIKGDGIAYLKEHPDESMAIISAFHVVEHISFKDLQLFIQEALRVLKPGGILMMETPNPENIKVATENFYLDPTHIKPIPSKLLSFLTEFYGYARIKVLRLQESKELTKQEDVNLLQIIEGVSPDYAVIAQKKADTDILKHFDEVFEKDLGLSLNTLAEKFEHRLLKIEAKANEAQTKATEAEAKAHESQTKASEAEAKAHESQTKASEAEARAHESQAKASEAEARAHEAQAKASEAEARAHESQAKASEAEAKAHEAEIRMHDALHHYHTVVNSHSWKLMKPFRKGGQFARWFATGVKHWVTFSPTSRPRRVAKKTLIALKHRINANPKLKMKLMSMLNHFPELKARLKRVGTAAAPTQPIHTQTDAPTQLSPRAQKIYHDLKKAIEAQKGK